MNMTRCWSICDAAALVFANLLPQISCRKSVAANHLPQITCCDASHLVRRRRDLETRKRVFVSMAALQFLAMPLGLAAVCALPSGRIHRFHHVPKPLRRRTRDRRRRRAKNCAEKTHDVWRWVAAHGGRLLGLVGQPIAKLASALLNSVASLACFKLAQCPARAYSP
jgi:hypothetical protein